MNPRNMIEALVVSWEGVSHETARASFTFVTNLLPYKQMAPGYESALASEKVHHITVQNECKKMSTNRTKFSSKPKLANFRRHFKG